MNNKKNILVLGSDGYLGKKLVYQLERDGFKIDKFDKFPKSSETKFIDTKNTKEILRVLENNSYDIIISLVGLLPGSALKKNLYNTNLSAVSFLKSCNLPSYFIFCSSTAVYKNTKFNSKMIEKPFEIYGHSKLDCEKIIKNTTSSYLIFRIGTMLSKDRQGGIMKLLKRLKSGKLVWLPRKGNVTHPFVDVDDVITAIKYSCNNNVNGTFDLIASNRKTLSDIAIELNPKQNIIKLNFFDFISKFIGFDSLPIFGISKWHLNALKYDIPKSQKEFLWKYTLLKDMSEVVKKSV